MTRRLFASVDRRGRAAAVAWLLLAVASAALGCDETDASEPPAPSGQARDGGPVTPSATPSQIASVAQEPSAKPAPPPPEDLWGDKVEWPGTFPEQNAHMLDLVVYHHRISAEQKKKLEAIFAASDVLGQGNPSAAKHAMSVAECRERVAKAEAPHDDPRFEKICGGKYMAPLYDPESEKPTDAKVCIDRFEFPDIPCAYPVTWVRSNEAVEICRAMGKRLCDAHEWEGACWGKLEPADYDFGARQRMGDVEHARKAMRGAHNLRVEKTKRWAYGPEYKEGVCATGSAKSKDCGGGWRKCGTNTYPAGSFPACVSPLGVWDIHGNAAEHMNLPLAANELASASEQKYGQTEMKGSWFVFDMIRAHEDHCRWRAPDWHGSSVMNTNSHRNYHLGMRCCKSLEPK